MKKLLSLLKRQSYLLLYLCIALFAFHHAQSAQSTVICGACKPSNLVDSVILNTGYNTSTQGPLSYGSLDYNWTLTAAPTWSGISTPSQPYSIQFCTPPGTGFANDTWISPFTSSSYNFNNGYNEPWTFEYHFCLCADDTVTIDLKGMVDDSMDIFLDNSYNFVLQNYLPSATYGGRDYGTTTHILSAGMHTIKVNLFNLGYGCFGFDLNGSIKGNHILKQGFCTAGVDLNPNFLTVTGNTQVCKSGSTTLTASGAVSYQWQPNFATDSSITVYPNGSTTYTVTGTNANGCTQTQVIAVTVNPVPIMNVTVYDPMPCAQPALGGFSIVPLGGAAPFTLVIGSNTYSGVPASGISTTSSFPPGIYTIQITDSNGCSSSQQYTVQSVTCCNSCNPISHADSLIINTGYDASTGNALAYGMLDNNWVITATPSWSGMTPPIQPYSIQFCVPPGTGYANDTWISPYNTATNNNNNGPNDPWTFEYRFCLCESDSVQLCFTSKADDSMSVFIDNIPIPMLGYITSTYGGRDYGCTSYALPAGTHTIQVQLFNIGGGCFGLDMHGTIKGNHLLKPGFCSASYLPGPDFLNVTASASSVCIGNSTTLNATGAASYDWQPGGSTDSSITVTPLTTTTYTVTATAANGCTQTSTITIVVNELPNLNVITYEAGCDSLNLGSFSFLPSSGAAPYTILVGMNTYNNVPSYGISTTGIYPAGTYTITIVDANGCSNTTVATINQMVGNTYVQNVTTCDFYNWSCDATSYVASGTYYCQQGCDTYVLNLTISNSTCSNTGSLTINTGIATNGAAISGNNIPDPIWLISDTTGANFAPATVIATVSPPYAVPSNARYINNPTLQSTAGSVIARRSFRMCHDDSVCIDLNIAADNYVGAIYVDNVMYFAGTPVADQYLSSNFTNFHNYHYCMYLTAGTHTLDVTLGNVNGPLGMAIMGTITGQLNSLVTNNSPAACCCISCVPTSETINVNACNSYTWFGTTYTQSGSYTHQTTNVSGCDSIITMNLTMNYDEHDTTIVTACDQYTWGCNSFTYYNSLTMYCNYQIQATQCQHYGTLLLTIVPSTSDTTYASICDGQGYNWPCAGMLYTAPGTYSCAPDNCTTHVLVLTVKPSCSAQTQLLISTGIDSNSTAQTGNNIADVFWKVSDLNGANFTAATVIPTYLAYAIPTNSRYIYNPTLAQQLGTVICRREFRMCQADQICFNLDIAADNYLGGILVDGVLITSPVTTTSVANQSNNINFNVFHNYSFCVSLSSGTHTLDVILGNTGSITGIDIQGSLTGSIHSLVGNTAPANCCCSPCVPTYNTLTAASCGSYTFNNMVYTQSGTYTQLTTNAAGCDSLITLNLTIHPLPVVTAPPVSACPGSSVNLGGSPTGGTWSLPNPYSGSATSYTYFYTDANGCSQSASATITNLSAAITNVQITNITGLTALVTFTPINGIGWYEIRYKPVSSSFWIVVTSNANNKLLTNLTPNTTYDVQVRGFCTTSNPGKWASGIFTTNNDCTTPSNIVMSAIASNQATVTWTAVGGATYYSVRYKPSTSTLWTTTTSTTNSKLLSGLTSATNYDVQVATGCSNSLSAYSSSTNFTTANACATPSGLFVSNIGNTTAKLNWSAVSGATYYNVRWKPISSTVWSNATSTTTNKVISGLTNYIQYEFQVQAVCVGGSSVYSASFNFTPYGMLKENNTVVNDEAVEYKLYPNPTRDEFTIALSLNKAAMVTVQLYDVSGRLVQVNDFFGAEGNNEFPLSIATLQSGLYTVQLVSDQQIIQTSRVTKE